MTITRVQNQNVEMHSALTNRRFPEIRGEIIWKSEAPAVGHHCRHRLRVHDFRMEAAVEKCWSVTISDLQAWTYTILDWQMALCARNTFFLSFAYHFLAGPHAVCPFGMADWLNRLRAFIIYTVFLIKNKNVKKIISGLCCIVSNASWLTRSRSLRAKDRIQNRE